MSHASPTGASTLFPTYTALYGGRWRVQRQIDVRNPSQVVDKLFPDFAAADGVPTTAATAGFADLHLVAKSLSPQRGSADGLLTLVYETLTDTLVDEVAPQVDYELNGLKRTTRQLIALPGAAVAAYVVGTQTYGTAPVQYLASVSIEEGEFATRIKATYLQAGVVQAQKVFDTAAGLLYVTFQSTGVKVVPTCLKGGSVLTDDMVVAFQGGVAASIFKDRVSEIQGYRTFSVTVMMKLDGSALAVGTDNEVADYQKYIPYQKPGTVAVSSAGIDSTPGASRFVKVGVKEYITTVGTVDSGYLPFSVTTWASVSATYIPTATQSPSTLFKGADGYLASSTSSGTNTTFAGIDCDSYAATASSSPTPSAFLALNNQVISSDNEPAFITDTGQRWYRKRKVTVVGTFSTYL